MHTHQDALPNIQWSGDQQRFGELAIFIDAIPAEFREEILLAVFHLHPDGKFSATYFVNFVRTLFHSCLAERTGNKEGHISLQGVDCPTVQQGLSPFAAAEDPVQVASALNDLMNLLSFAPATSTEECLN
jgi:hypothetical protein